MKPYILLLSLICLAGLVTNAQPAPASIKSSQEKFGQWQKEAIERQPDDVVLRGHIGQSQAGNAVFMTAKGEPLPLLDATALTKLPPRVTVDVAARKDREKGAFKVTTVTPSLLGTWRTQSKDMFPADKFPKLYAAYDTLERASSNLKPNSLDTADLQRLQIGFSEIEVASVDAFTTAAGDPVLTKSLCRQYEAARMSRKAIYARLDSYRPDVYRMIFENSKSAVAIVRKRGALREVEGSGVLIGQDLVLTCNHCVSTNNKNDWEIWFDFANADNPPKDAYEVDEILLRGIAPTPGRPELDFCLLKVRPRQGAIPIAITRPHLSTHALRRDDAIYVVGYPLRTPRTVHDNAFVMFPFQVDERQLTELKMFVCAESDRSKDRGLLLEDFLKSYLPSTRQPGTFENFCAKWNSPVILADCDTFHGDSGAAAYDRKTGDVVGILVAGEPDNARYPEAGWRHHEAIIPIGEIIQQIEANPKTKGWRSQFNVKIR